MKEKERHEIEEIYWELARCEKRLATIYAREDKKWNNLGDGDGTLLEKTSMGQKLDAESLVIDESRRTVSKVLEALKICIACLGATRGDLDRLRPMK